MIEVKDICKSFGEKSVLKNVSATFEDGKTNLIIGQGRFRSDRAYEDHCRTS